jgi:hypothetical protein
LDTAVYEDDCYHERVDGVDEAHEVHSNEPQSA